MRKIEFNELKLKSNCSEEQFYEIYIQRIDSAPTESTIISKPVKKYEVCLLNILHGKIIAINKNYINNDNFDGQELYYNYDIAKQIANYLADIQDGIIAEQYEFIELYKDERLKKDKLISELKLQDEKTFNEKEKEYNNIINSKLYSEYQKILEENNKLKLENKNLIMANQKKARFFSKLVNKIKNKKILNGE